MSITAVLDPGGVNATKHTRTRRTYARGHYATRPYRRHCDRSGLAVRNGRSATAVSKKTGSDENRPLSKGELLFFEQIDVVVYRRRRTVDRSATGVWRTNVKNNVPTIFESGFPLNVRVPNVGVAQIVINYVGPKPKRNEPSSLGVN